MREKTKTRINRKRSREGVTGLRGFKPWLLALVSEDELFFSSHIRYFNCLLTNQIFKHQLMFPPKKLHPKDSWNSSGTASPHANNLRPRQQVREVTPKEWGKSTERQTGWRRWLLVCHCKQHYIIKPIEFPAVFQACWPAATFLIQQLQSTEGI